MEGEQGQQPQVEEAVRSFFAEFMGSIGRRALAVGYPEKRNRASGICIMAEF